MILMMIRLETKLAEMFGGSSLLAHLDPQMEREDATNEACEA